MLSHRLIVGFLLLLLLFFGDSFALMRNSIISSQSLLQEARLLEVKVIPQADNTYVVPVELNHTQSAAFLVDTGASYTVITPRLARNLGLPTRRSRNSLLINTFNGQIHAPVVTIKQFKLGKLNFQNVTVVVAELGKTPGISGLLGMNFFQGRTLVLTPHHLYVGRK